MNRIEKRIREHYDAEFTYHEDVLLHIVARSQEVDTGARNIENILTRTMLPEMASECLSRMANGESITKIHVGVTDDGMFVYELHSDDNLSDVQIAVTEEGELSYEVN